MLGGATWRRNAALLLALAAGSIAASAPAPPSSASSWTADPDDQFLLDVTIRQLRLGDGVRAYNTPEGTCVVLGDFVTTLDVPVKIDLQAKKATGWAFLESNRIDVDYGTGTATYGTGKSERLRPGTIRQTPEGWCVQTTALARWFGIGVTPVTAGAALVLQSDSKLPVELAREREERAARIHPAALDLSGLPRVRIPYRMWRAPALDFVVSAGVTYRAQDGVQVDRQSSVFAAGEIAHMSYDAQLTTSETGKPESLRLRAFRSDADGKLLGPLHATHFGVGDVEGFESGLTGSSAAGRGAVVTNRPLTTPSSFGQTRFEGDLPSGWEAEIYRNDELLAFTQSTADQRYVFDNVQLLYGENNIRIVLYGPQGQIRTREEVVDVGQDSAPPGKTWYWAGFNQPTRDIITLEKPPDAPEVPKAQATVALEHGIDDKTSAAALARTMLFDDERVTFVEGTVRRSIGKALVEVGAARELGGGSAARAQVLGQIGSVNLNAEAIVANDFHLRGQNRETLRDYRVDLDAPLKIGRTTIPGHAELHMLDQRDGTKQVDAAMRLSANVQRFNLAGGINYQQIYAAGGASSPAEVYLNLIGSGRLGEIRLRGLTEFDVSPSARFRTAELSAYWSASDNVDWEGDLAYDGAGKRGRVRLSYIRRFYGLAAAFTAEGATDGSVAFGLNLNFSLDASRGFGLSRVPLAQSGLVHATVYRDLNDNGVHDSDEPFEKGALVTTGNQLSEHSTNAKGMVTVAGLTPYAPIAVGIDESSLSDPMLVPKTALQVVVPRPGVAADVQIGLVGGGDIEGSIVKSGGLGFEGLDIELVDAAGKLVGTTRTDFDGFFLFERVAYGHYSIRVAASSAAAAKIATDLGAHFEVTESKAVTRLGSLHVTALPQVAATSGSDVPALR